MNLNNNYLEEFEKNVMNSNELSMHKNEYNEDTNQKRSKIPPYFKEKRNILKKRLSSYDDFADDDSSYYYKRKTSSKG